MIVKFLDALKSLMLELSRELEFRQYRQELALARKRSQLYK